jgi:acyl carrier protein
MEHPSTYVPKKIVEYHDKIRTVELPPEKTLESLGLDSLDVIKLGTYVEEYYHTVIPDEEYDRIKTVQDLVDAVIRYTPKGVKYDSPVV